MEKELRPQFEQSSTPRSSEREGFLEARSETPRAETREISEPRREESSTKVEQGKKRFYNPLRKSPPVLPSIKDDITSKIEKVLEKNIGEAYQNLSPSGKEAFKIKGEKTAGVVKEMIESGRAKAYKIFQLIFDWLRLLPGVNRFFLEQEAKIKTDELIKLQKHEA